MNVLIIGSKGFIGSHTFSYFKNFNNNTVFGCDVHTGYGENNYFQIDVSNSDFKNVFKSNEFDICINCSGAASVPDSFSAPFRDFSLNTLNVIKILEAIREYNPNCKFINLSSAAVYGNPNSLPIQESDVCNPLSPYGFHKRQAENICEEYSKLYNIRTCSVRIFSAFGPGLKKQLFWDLYQKSLNSTEIELWGTGEESRDFIFINDLIHALYLISEKAEMNGECINVANGEEVFINNAVHIFFSALNSNHKIRFKGAEKKGYPINWKADIGILKKMGYSPKYTIKSGIEEYIKWLKEKR